MWTRVLSVGACAIAFAILPHSAFSQQRQLNWAEKMFSELSHDFGTVARGADTRATLVVTNIYEEDVTIVNVGTTCGCTAAQPDKTHLKTHEQARVEIQMNTTKFMRRKDSNVDVTLTFHGANGSSTKTVRVPITAYIRSDVVLTPGNADFGTVEYGTGAERKIEVAYAGRDNWAIKGVRVGNDKLAAEVRELSRSPGQVTYELTVRLEEGAAMGAISDQIALVTDDANSPEVPVLVTGRIQPDIEVTPSTLPLGKLKPGDVKEFRVVVKGKRPFTIEHIQCDSADCFEVMQPSDQAKTVHIVPFKITAPSTPGDFSENFTFTIGGRSEPLSFRAEGTIAAGT